MPLFADTHAAVLPERSRADTEHDLELMQSSDMGVDMKVLGAMWQQRQPMTTPQEIAGALLKAVTKMPARFGPVGTSREQKASLHKYAGLVAWSLGGGRAKLSKSFQQVVKASQSARQFAEGFRGIFFPVLMKYMYNEASDLTQLGKKKPPSHHRNLDARSGDDDTESGSDGGGSRKHARFDVGAVYTPIVPQKQQGTTHPDGISLQVTHEMWRDRALTAALGVVRKALAASWFPHGLGAERAAAAAARRVAGHLVTLELDAVQEDQKRHPHAPLGIAPVAARVDIVAGWLVRMGTAEDTCESAARKLKHFTKVKLLLGRPEASFPVKDAAMLKRLAELGLQTLLADAGCPECATPRRRSV